MSIWELLVVAFVSLVVIGPKQIPQVAFKLGQWAGYLKNLWYALACELRQHVQTDIESQQKPPCNKQQD